MRRAFVRFALGLGRMVVFDMNSGRFEIVIVLHCKGFR